LVGACVWPKLAEIVGIEAIYINSHNITVELRQNAAGWVISQPRAGLDNCLADQFRISPKENIEKSYVNLLGEMDRGIFGVALK